MTKLPEVGKLYRLKNTNTIFEIEDVVRKNISIRNASVPYYGAISIDIDQLENEFEELQDQPTEGSISESLEEKDTYKLLWESNAEASNVIIEELKNQVKELQSQVKYLRKQFYKSN